jgi:hypothetical protein
MLGQRELSPRASDIPLRLGGLIFPMLALLVWLGAAFSPRRPW